jgi:hypothetical protein
MTQTDKHLHEQKPDGNWRYFSIREFAKYPKMRVPNADKGREGVTALSQNVATAAVQVWSVCTRCSQMWTGMEST